MDVLIVDDETNIRRALRALLMSDGWEVREADTAETAIELARTDPPEVILLDLALPGLSGLEALPLFDEVTPGTPVVMMSGQATIGDAVQATRRGAFHFLEKPLTPEAVLVTLRSALELRRARDLNRALSEELGAGTQLVGKSSAMARLSEQIRKVAPTQARILISGESGTGKELVASAIHRLSTRSSGPFVRVNSAAIPRHLVESEMFGHERGAFTGATDRRRGRFELASGGTLFLDEVADLDGGAQAKLLRAVESGTIERVGGVRTIETDVRILSATNRDLQEEIQAGRFREDLFFRLNVVPIHIPPLRDRQEDIPLLVTHALDRLRSKHGLPSPRFTDGAMVALRRHRWPGNVRELLNLVERLVVLHPDQAVDEEAVSVLVRSPGDRESRLGDAAGEIHEKASLSEQLADFERTLIESALTRAEGNVAKASRLLFTDRANLHRRMRRLGL